MKSVARLVELLEVLVGRGGVRLLGRVSCGVVEVGSVVSGMLSEVVVGGSRVEVLVKGRSEVMLAGRVCEVALEESVTVEEVSGGDVIGGVIVGVSKDEFVGNGSVVASVLDVSVNEASTVGELVSVASVLEAVVPRRLVVTGSEVSNDEVVLLSSVVLVLLSDGKGGDRVLRSEEMLLAIELKMSVLVDEVLMSVI